MLLKGAVISVISLLRHFVFLTLASTPYLGAVTVFLLPTHNACNRWQAQEKMQWPNHVADLFGF